MKRSLPFLLLVGILILGVTGCGPKGYIVKMEAASREGSPLLGALLQDDQVRAIRVNAKNNEGVKVILSYQIYENGKAKSVLDKQAMVMQYDKGIDGEIAIKFRPHRSQKELEMVFILTNGDSYTTSTYAVPISFDKGEILARSIEEETVLTPNSPEAIFCWSRNGQADGTLVEQAESADLAILVKLTIL